MLMFAQAGFRKGRGTRDQIADIRWIIEKGREFQKKSTSALLTTSKPLTVWITTNCGKFFKRWEYQIGTLLPFDRSGYHLYFNHVSWTSEVKDSVGSHKLERGRVGMEFISNWL